MMKNPAAIGSQEPLASIRCTVDQLPDAIHTALRRAGKSQRTFADEAGYNECHVSNVIRGKKKLTLDFLQAVQHNLGLRIVLIP